VVAIAPVLKAGRDAKSRVMADHGPRVWPAATVGIHGALGGLYLVLARGTNAHLGRLRDRRPMASSIGRAARAARESEQGR
jgi:hypothetical protein